jgi:probable biosynthetic protein (TIGR04099 family)
MLQATHGYRAGMPQLCFTGLSENWLLKECGHLHWEALARHSGRVSPDFVAENGSRSYAAFTAVRLRASGLDTFAENDDFEILTSLCRTGAVRHFSAHRIVRDGKACASLAMATTFVQRHAVRDNRSVARAALAALAGDVSAVPETAKEMTALGKRLRTGEREACPRLAACAPSPHAPSVFLPCPNSDFNGADFLYFSSFAVFVDRAEWQRHVFAEPPLLVSRDLHYYGNVNVGDSLEIRVIAEQLDENGIAHWCEVRRRSDRQKIADVLTEKHWRRR